MATIGTASHSSYLNTPRRAYITTTAFQNDIFRYTTSTNPATFEVTGTLTSLATVGTGTSATCPANRILVENGKKLYPSGLAISNNTTYGAPNPGVTTYMVGVYDPGSFLSGFIDPNSKVFAPYNTDKPDYVPRGVNPNGNTEIDQGPPVYTLGSVTAGTTVTAGTAVVAGTSVSAGTALGFGGSGYSGPASATQLTSKSTDVAVNGPVVDVTMNNAALAAHTAVTFELQNTSIDADDTIVCVHTDADVGKYVVYGKATGPGTADITLGNVTATSESDACVIRIVVLKS